MMRAQTVYGSGRPEGTYARVGFAFCPSGGGGFVGGREQKVLG